MQSWHPQPNTMYKIICPKCETIQLYPDNGIEGPNWFCSHLNDALVQSCDAKDSDKPLDIQQIACKVVHIT